MGLPGTARLCRGDLARATQAPRIRQSSGPVTVTLSLTGRCAQHGPKQQVKIGFAVGRTVGGAVIRNLVRRRLRAGMSRLLPALALGLGDGVTLVVVRINPVGASMTAAELDRHLQRAVRLCLERVSRSMPPAAVSP